MSLLADLRQYLKDLEQWEADMVKDDNCWKADDCLPKMTLALYDRWCYDENNLQQRRNELLERLEKETQP